MRVKEIQEHNAERLRNVSSFLKGYRINNGFSQQEIADRGSIHRNSVNKAEKISNPANLNLLTIFSIADALELDVNQIFLEIE